MRTAGYVLLGAMSLLGLLGKAEALRSEPVVEIAGVSYQFPKEYKASASDDTDSVLIQFSRQDLTPLEIDAQGWNDNINLLVSKRINTIPMLYSDIWDGSPKDFATTGMMKVVQIYRIEPDLMVREMEKFHDVVIPDQDMNSMPIGMIHCLHPSEHMMNSACSLMFDKEDQRWKISFGRQYLSEYKRIRAAVEAKMKEFEVAE